MCLKRPNLKCIYLSNCYKKKKKKKKTLYDCFNAFAVLLHFLFRNNNCRQFPYVMRNPPKIDSSPSIFSIRIFTHHFSLKYVSLNTGWGVM